MIISYQIDNSNIFPYRARSFVTFKALSDFSAVAVWSEKKNIINILNKNTMRLAKSIRRKHWQTSVLLVISDTVGSGVDTLNNEAADIPVDQIYVVLRSLWQH